MKRLLFIVFTLLSLQIQAQTSDDDVPDFNLLRFRVSKFNLIDKNKLVIKTRLSRQEIFTLLTDHPNALSHYNKYRTFNTIKWTARGVGFGAMLAGIGVALATNGKDPDQIGEYLFIGGAASLIVIQIPITITAHRQAVKTIENYNMDVHKEQKKYSISVQGINHGIGLVLNFP